MRQTLVLLALLGCSDDEAPGGGGLDGGPDASLDAGDAARDLDASDAGDADAATCTLEGQLASRIAPQATDCGALSLDPMTAAGDTAYQSVRACVLDAVASGAPFHASKVEQGIDSLVTSAFVRERQGGDIGLLRGDVGFGSSTVFEERCFTLREVTPCRETRPELCLLCEQTTEPKLLCRASR